MNQAPSGPRLIAGGSHTDERGTVSFVNDFDFAGVDRFYTIGYARPNIPRGWIGHRREVKWFTAVHGEVRIAVVEPDDWASPTSDLPVNRYTLSAHTPQILHVPAGHATASAGLTDDALLLVFSSGRIEDTKSDDYRFPADTWDFAD